MRTTADAVVVGAGVVGAAVLYELTARGVDAVLIERGAPNRQGSGTTAGNLHIQAIHSGRPEQSIPVDTAGLVPFQAQASILWRGLEERLGRELDITVGGGLTVAETAEQLERLREKASWEAAAGIPTEILDGAAARERVPELSADVLAATWCPWDGWANNLVVTPAYLEEARKRGARVYTHSPVDRIERMASGWTVESTAVTVDTPIVIDAAGPWLDRVAVMAGIELRLAPLAIQMLESVRVPRRLNHLVQHIGEGLSVKQVGSGSIVIGGGWPAAHLALGGISPVSPDSVAGIIAQVRRVLPGLAGTRLSRAWAGPLAATPDEMPVVGAVGGAPGFHIVGGTYAFTFSPLWAHAIADDIAGAAPIADVSAFSPTRLLATAPIGA